MIFHMPIWNMYDVHAWMVQWGLERDSLSTPSNLTIITCHNYSEKTYTEKHMDYVGIEYVTLQPDDLTAQWKNTNKISLPYEYIRDGRCSTDYVIVIDASDVVFVNHPSTCMSVLDSYDCDMLFCGTLYWPVMMLELKEESELLQKTDFHINSGVWIAKTNSCLDILEDVNSFIDDSVYDGDWKTYSSLRNEKIDISFKDEWFPDYPHGIPSDQDLFRWVYPKYYPRMLIDVNLEFSRRNRSDMVNWIFDNKATTN